jgi:hypothetical protein
MNRRFDDARQDLPALLRTIARCAVNGFGIPTFNELTEFTPPEAFNLMTAALGDKSSPIIRDLKHDAIEYAAAGNKQEAGYALDRLEDAFVKRQTFHAEAHYLTGIIVTFRAINIARGLANLETTNVITELVSRREEGATRDLHDFNPKGGAR